MQTFPPASLLADNPMVHSAPEVAECERSEYIRSMMYGTIDWRKKWNGEYGRYLPTIPQYHNIMVPIHHHRYVPIYRYIRVLNRPYRNKLRTKKRHGNTNSMNMMTRHSPRHPFNVGAPTFILLVIGALISPASAVSILFPPLYFLY